MTTIAKRRKGAAPLGRADRSPFSMWFWEIDRVLLLLVLLLVSIGLIAVAAASPAAAARHMVGEGHLPPLYYFWRQVGFVALGLPVMFVISTMPTQMARRYALFGAAFFSVMLVTVPLIGSSANGAQRWIGSGMLRFQPSEFLKPFYVVAMAWMLSLREQEPTLPIVPLTGALTAIIAALLMKEPDFGQTIIFCMSWLALMLLGGMSMKLIGLFGAAGGVGVVAAYEFYPVATQRINDFLFPALGEHNQIDAAHETIMAGGLFGTGPGAGVMKYRLPESHTDYIFS
ncbi:MAG: FtsW/RodA/SpoVE family cell cycle protein, partial [Alphaproteobacteria bacterium]|nr:FtsW/RodA/SpoVE family cell cycle protein [Alphaproteobacteria bacterium]